MQVYHVQQLHNGLWLTPHTTALRAVITIHYARFRDEHYASFRCNHYAQRPLSRWTLCSSNIKHKASQGISRHNVSQSSSSSIHTMNDRQTYNTFTQSIREESLPVSFLTIFGSVGSRGRQMSNPISIRDNQSISFPYVYFNNSLSWLSFRTL